MADRDELEALRRLAELESRANIAAPAAAPTQAAPVRTNWRGQPMSPQAVAAMADLKARPFGSGIPDFAHKVGERTVDIQTQLKASPEIAARNAYLDNVLTQAIPALASSFRFAGEAPAALLEKPAKALMQSAVKPALQDRASGAADKAIQTMLQEGINPTRGGMDKAGKMATQLEQQVQAAIAGSPESVNVAQVGSRLRTPYERALNQVNPEADLKAVRSAWDEFRQSPQIAGKMDIPVQLAQKLKSGTYSSLGGKSYGEVGTASTEAQKALARGLREEIAAKVPEVVEPLKREAALMNVRDVAMNRALQQANNNPLGLAALRIGDNPLSALSFMADKSALVKSLLARMLYTGSQPQLLTPAGIAAAEAMHQPKEQ